MTGLAGESSPFQPPCSVLVARYLPLHAAVFGTIAFIKQPGWIAGGFGGLLWLAGLLAIRHRDFDDRAAFASNESAIQSGLVMAARADRAVGHWRSHVDCAWRISLNLARRRQIMLCALALLAVWPAGQQVLIYKWNANPWELCGFAMYVQPDLPAEVYIRAPTGELVKPDQLGSTVAVAFKRYQQQARKIGLLSPNGDLRAVFRSAGLPYSYVDIEVTRRILFRNGTLGKRMRSMRISLHESSR
jgi:hypothetical protein